MSASPMAEAVILAYDAHHKQKDKAGAPYIEHPRAVALMVQRAGYDDRTIALAWLHDVVEDTEVTLDLIRERFDEEMALDVEAISQHKREDRDAYYARVLARPRAAVVKHFDVAHNSSEDRLAKLPPETQERLGEKYVKARRILGRVPTPAQIAAL